MEAKLKMAHPQRVILTLALSFVASASLVPLSPVRAETRPPILEVRGVLEPGDNVLDEDSTLYDVYPFQGRAGQSVTILLESPDFDTYVLVADAEGKVLEENDDINEKNSNSKIILTLPKNGTYNIIVNGYEAKDRGNYSLTVNE